MTYISALFDGKKQIDVIIERNELNVSLLETKYSKVFQRKAMQKSPYRLEDFRKKTVERTITVSDLVAPELLIMLAVSHLHSSILRIQMRMTENAMEQRNIRITR
mgnify:CR=1 FL=1